MIIDINGVGEDFFAQPFDVCVSGTGPAGMTLALKLAQKNYRVLLLEAGDLQYTEQSTKVYEGTNTGLDYFPAAISRQRFFGGTSNHWGGWVHEMIERDFEKRDHVPLSGWPITLSDITPFFEEANSILDVKTPFTPDYVLQNEAHAEVESIAFRFSDPPTRFGQKYRQEIEASANLTCLINANLVDIVLDESGENINSFVVATYENKRFNANARYYALCHGGIENPRTLLNCNKQNSKGVGNSNDWVGKCFSEHPHFVVGQGILNFDNPGMIKIIKEHPQDLRIAFYQASKKFQEENKTLSFAFRFEPGRSIFDPNRSVSWKDRIKAIMCSSETIADVTDIACPFDFSIRTAAEQCPNESSRILLSDDLDQFGNKRVNVHWQLNELDFHTLKSSALLAGKVIAQRDLGRLKVSEWLLDEGGMNFPTTAQDEVGGFHHMGTTRMADSPSRGVVDKDLKVFGTNNLFIAGSSVFPTVGHCNPTFTIVQLSLRLAKHLESKLV